jgi:oxygen-dependent protoporphyrinogen oxidase
LRRSVVVIGAGVAGLAAAWELTGGAGGPGDETPRVEVVEASREVGGTLATTTFAGRVVDRGADGFLARRPEATTLADELGLREQLEAVASSGASIWLRGALHELPTGLVLGVPTSSAMVRSLRGLSWRARLHARRDELLPKRMNVGDDVTIGAILRTKLGDELTYQLIEPMIGGIQAGRVDELSAISVFPALVDAAKRGGSLMKALASIGPSTPGPSSPTSVAGPLFYSLIDGVGSLPAALTRQLRARGVVVRTASPVTALRRSPSGAYPWEVDTANTTTPANAIVVATPAPVAAELIGRFDPALAALGFVHYASAAMVTFSVPRTQVTLPEHGTGVLVPLGAAWAGEGTMMVTAITLLDRKWPHLAREHDVLVRAHVGRSDDERWTALDDEALVTRVAHELAALLGRFDGPVASMVQRWPQGLAQYVVGHERVVSAARLAASTMKLALAGSAYDGVGLPASIGSGRGAGRTILAALAN